MKLQDAYLNKNSVYVKPPQTTKFGAGSSPSEEQKESDNYDEFINNLHTKINRAKQERDIALLEGERLEKGNDHLRKLMSGNAFKPEDLLSPLRRSHSALASSDIFAHESPTPLISRSSRPSSAHSAPIGNDKSDESLNRFFEQFSLPQKGKSKQVEGAFSTSIPQPKQEASSKNPVRVIRRVVSDWQLKQTRKNLQEFSKLVATQPMAIHHLSKTTQGIEKINSAIRKAPESLQKDVAEGVRIANPKAKPTSLRTGFLRTRKSLKFEPVSASPSEGRSEKAQSSPYQSPAASDARTNSVDSRTGKRFSEMFNIIRK